MPARKFTDEQLLIALEKTRSTAKLAAQFGISERGMAMRMRALGIPPADNWKAAQDAKPTPTVLTEAIGRMRVDMPDGRAIVFSDAHFQPDAISTANRALVKLCADLRPNLVVCNGDAVDGAGTSRHGPTFGAKQVTPAAELRACQERLDEIADAAKGAQKIFTLGNHDIRLHTYLATNAPQIADLPGLDLRELFPRWKFCWSLFVNGDTIIKHRYRGGQYAPANNVRGALGQNFVTGHLHSLKVIPLSAYSDRTFFGVDTGMLAEPEWESFAYREDSPADWRSGFVVLHWRDGKMLWPEVCWSVAEGVVNWRGELIEV
jgi:hypothetical protein